MSIWQVWGTGIYIVLLAIDRTQLRPGWLIQVAEIYDINVMIASVDSRRHG